MRVWGCLPLCIKLLRCVGPHVCSCAAVPHGRTRLWLAWGGVLCWESMCLCKEASYPPVMWSLYLWGALSAWTQDTNMHVMTVFPHFGKGLCGCCQQVLVRCISLYLVLHVRNSLFLLQPACHVMAAVALGAVAQ